MTAPKLVRPDDAEALTTAEDVIAELSRLARRMLAGGWRVNLATEDAPGGEHRFTLSGERQPRADREREAIRPSGQGKSP